jgi:cobalt/nickel transport system permease protein
MHMADALVSPAVGGAMWAVTAGTALFSAHKLQKEQDDKKIPLMGVMGAFIFAAQMINFTIPGTGSSGHLGGGLLLAIMLGPYAGFLTMASILAIQALFFADGGLLALGCNVFNLGFYACFIGYPLIYKLIVKGKMSQGRIFWGSFLAGIIGLQLGAFSVVLETLCSGISELPFNTFVLLMQPIHLAIGVVEGLVTATVVSFIWRARPEIIENVSVAKPIGNVRLKPVLIGLLIAALITGGALSWFASVYPDGLEWSMAKTSGQEELAPRNQVQRILAQFQAKTAFMRDYDFKKTSSETTTAREGKGPTTPDISGGTSIAGLAGAVFTLILAALIGFGLRFLKKRKRIENA